MISLRDLRQKPKKPVPMRTGAHNKWHWLPDTRRWGVKKGKTKCTNPNCLKTSHTIDKCLEKGGGAEGKAPDWYMEMKVKKQWEEGHAAMDKSNTHSTGSESLA